MTHARRFITPLFIPPVDPPRSPIVNRGCGPSDACIQYSILLQEIASRCRHTSWTAALVTPCVANLDSVRKPECELPCDATLVQAVCMPSFCVDRSCLSVRVDVWADRAEVRTPASICAELAVDLRSALNEALRTLKCCA